MEIVQYILCTQVNQYVINIIPLLYIQMIVFYYFKTISRFLLYGFLKKVKKTFLTIFHKTNLKLTEELIRK